MTKQVPEALKKGQKGSAMSGKLQHKRAKTKVSMGRWSGAQHYVLLIIV